MNARTAKKSKLFVFGCGEDYQLGLSVDLISTGTDDHRMQEQMKKKLPLDFNVSVPQEVPNEHLLELHDGNDERREIEQIVGGSRNACVLTNLKELIAWGWNSHDTLGLGDIENDSFCEESSGVRGANERREEFVIKPRKAMYFEHDTTKELDVGMKDEFVQSKIEQIALGGWHALAIDQYGRVHAWGGNEYGQCAQEKRKMTERGEIELFLQIATPVTIPLDYRQPRQLIKAKRVACGGMSSFVITLSGDVYQWGCPVGGVGPNVYRPQKIDGLRDAREIAAGSFHVLVLTKDGQVFSWGHGEYGQLGHQKTGNEDRPRAIELLNRKGVVKIFAGGWHSACVTVGGNMLMWGRGEYARLGMGDDDCTDKVTPTKVKFPANFNEVSIIDASLGGSHTIALTNKGEILSWGRNSLGRLGRYCEGPFSGVPGVVKLPPLSGEREYLCTKVSCGGRHNMCLCIETESIEERERLLRTWTERVHFDEQ